MAPKGKRATRNSNQRAQLSPAETALEEAEQCQQRAERRRGEDAIRQYAQAVSKYEEALQLGLQGETKSNALVSLADALQDWAEQVLAVEAKLPEERQNAELAQQAASQAVSLLERSLRVYEALLRDAGGAWQRADAAVGCGNALSQLAELQGPEEQARLLQKAVQCYEAARALEEDALTWSNAADALMQLAEVLAAAGSLDEAEERVRAARAAYESATALSHSDDGDDLPGLLCNWGSGLVAAAKMAAAAGQDGAAVELLREAVSRLEASVAFNRADIQVETLLGETYVALAELLPASEAAPALQKGLEVGFKAALLIDATHGPALASKGEAHLLGSRIAARLGDDAERHSQLAAAVDSFERALRRPESLGSNSERCNVRYNYACALALLARGQEACAQLSVVLKRDPAVLEDIAGDDDFTLLRDMDAFAKVVEAAAAANSHRAGA